MREFTAKSYAEKRLERAHADGEDRVTPEDVHESSVEASEALAQLIADDNVLACRECGTEYHNDLVAELL